MISQEQFGLTILCRLLKTNSFKYAAATPQKRRKEMEILSPKPVNLVQAINQLSCTV